MMFPPHSSNQSARLRRLLLASVTSLALVTAISACSPTPPDSTPGPDGLRTVVVGANPIVDIAPLWVGDAAGIFEKHGIKLEIETGGGGAALLPTVISGQFQFAFANPTTLMVAQEKGLEVKVVSNLASSTGVEGRDGSAILVAEDSAIKTASDLEGKTVAVNTLNSIGTTAIRESVRKDGGDPDEVTFIEVGFGDMMATISNGHVDAVWEVEPFISSSLTDGYRAVAWPYIDVSPAMPIALTFTSAKLAKEDPKLVEDFVSALSESIDYSNANPEKVLEAVPTFTTLEAEQVENIFFPVWAINVDRDAVQKLADLALDDGIVKEKPDLDKLLP